MYHKSSAKHISGGCCLKISPYGTLLLLGLPHKRGLGHGRVSITEKERQTEAVSQDVKHHCCYTVGQSSYVAVQVRRERKQTAS